MRALIFITGHVIYNPKFQLKTTLVSFSESLTYSHHDCLVLENWVDIIPHNFNYSNVPSLPTLIFYWILLVILLHFKQAKQAKEATNPLLWSANEEFRQGNKAGGMVLKLVGTSNL